MADHKKIARHLDLVLKSQCFSKSAVNRELFKYLINASIKGEDPKEFQIAHDVFGKNSNQEKELNIRVYIHNLRKKLEEYYKREGKDDEIRFEIPKGKYVVLFKSNIYKTYSKTLFRIAPFLLIISLLLLLLTFFLYQHRKSPKIVRKSFWNEIVKSNNRLLLVLGDHYFFSLNSNNPVSGSIRVGGINSDKELDMFIAQNPKLIKLVQKTSLTYINSQAPFGLYKIMNLLGGGLIDIDMIYSSKLRWNDMEGKNVIFIGSYKTQNLLKTFNEKIGINYDIKNGILSYSTSDTTIVFNNHVKDILDYEYATFSHFITDKGNTIIFFMCDNDIGNIGSLKFLTSMDGLNKMEGILSKIKSHNYKAVFEVKGREKTDFEVNILRVDPINIPISEVWP